MKILRRSKKGIEGTLIDEYMTYAEAAHRLDISISTLERLVRANKVSRVKYGGRTYFTEAHLLDYKKRCEEGNSDI